MICDVTLKAEKFRTIHNALWDLKMIQCDLAGAIHPDRLEKLAQVEEEIRAALADAYKQEDQAYDRRQKHYILAAEAIEARSVWSLSEVEDLWAAHPYLGARFVCYTSHWGKNHPQVPIEGLRWLDLWRAADQCIRASGDDHHIFIETFEDRGDGVLFLHTGS